MGRQPYSDRHTVEQCLELGVTQLKQWGCFDKAESAWSFEWKSDSRETPSNVILGVHLSGEEEKCDSYMLLKYAWQNEFTETMDFINQRIDLVKSPCTFGGVRYYFVCPLCRDADRKVGKLYLPPDRRHFGCRHCYDLTYRSSQEAHCLDRRAKWFTKLLDYEYPEWEVEEMLKRWFSRGREART
jgi:hypothetical protein